MEWKLIPRHQNYEVSNIGTVRLIGNDKLKCISVNNQGYFKVCINGANEFCHTLVAEAFIGPRPKGLVVDHRDNDKTNNAPSNLSWVTQSLNSKQSGRNSRFHPGEFWLMKKLLIHGVSQRTICKMFKCSQQAISYHFSKLNLPNIRNRRIHKVS